MNRSSSSGGDGNATTTKAGVGTSQLSAETLALVHLDVPFYIHHPVEEETNAAAFAMPASVVVFPLGEIGEAATTTAKRKLSDAVMTRLYVEALEMLALECPHLAVFVGCLIDATPMGVVYQYSAKGTLEDVLVMEGLHIDDEFGLVFWGECVFAFSNRLPFVF